MGCEKLTDIWDEAGQNRPATVRVSGSAGKTAFQYFVTTARIGYRRIKQVCTGYEQINQR
jgi:hypothetical protein